MRQDQQKLLDITIGDYAVVPDRPQKPPPQAVERQQQFETQRRKLKALREMRLNGTLEQ